MIRVSRSNLLSAALLLGVATSAHATPTVTATATAGATNLSMDSSGGTVTRIVKVADVAFSSDVSFTLSITSGTMTKSSGTPVPFQVAMVDVAAQAPTASAFTTASGATLMYDGSGSQEKALYIKYSLPVYQDPGTYNAQIGLEIFDN